VYSHRWLALVAFMLVPGVGRTQPAPPYDPVGAVQISQFRPIALLAADPSVEGVTGDGVGKEEGPHEDARPCEPAGRHLCWSEVWGFAGIDLFPAGNHIAPNGVPFHPLATLDFEFNLGLLPNKELYLFADNKFWTQKAMSGVTNPTQGQYDFSKREYDLQLGAAWTYYNDLEFRVSTYGLNNLNRGTSLSSPSGFKDGILLENCYYLGNADIYDVSRLSFLSIGYYPAKSLVAGDGSEFHPGLFARAYLTYDLPVIRSYVYFDGTFTAERVVKARLLEMDLGLAARPFLRWQNLEFRLGYDVTGDVQADTTHNLIYGAIRILY
jgi:hypothetical protein